MTAERAWTEEKLIEMRRKAVDFSPCNAVTRHRDWSGQHPAEGRPVTLRESNQLECSVH